MHISEENIRIIFGLKLRQLRTEKNLSLVELAERSGLSVSYLNEIEKGKKYPKGNKIAALSSALDTAYDKLVSLKLGKNLAPVGELLRSQALSDLPLELFGIELNKLIDIISNAPEKVNAFISTIIEIARNYNLTQENFYFAALRSYQESHDNYFDDIEKRAEEFVKKNGVNNLEKVSSSSMESLLREKYNYIVDSDELAKNKDLFQLRSVFIPGNPNRLLLHPKLSDSQRAFVLAKELGYNYLELRERGNSSYWSKAETFDQLLNNFKASYFAGALLINKKALIPELEHFFRLKTWNGNTFFSMMNRFTSSPEMFMHRLTNILPEYFHINNLFFLRFNKTNKTDYYTLTKELHLTQLHNPHASALDEHYCRRWVSLRVLKEIERNRLKENSKEPVIGAQRSKYSNSENEYFVIAVARPMVRTPNAGCSVSIGFLYNNELKKKIRFLEDDGVPLKIVGETCERCAVENCIERAVPAIHIEREKTAKKTETALEDLIEKFK